jgi:hypothetical protein
MMRDNPTVKDLVEAVYSGEIVLPDFQRSFIWCPEDVRELLVSVLGDYFIGTMLIQEVSKDDSPFALRFVEGAEEINPEISKQSIVTIILDGQQRTTALFYALYAPDLPLKGRKAPYRFYLDLERALENDWDGAVIGVNVKDMRKLREIEAKETIIPFTLLRDFKEVAKKFKNHSQFEQILELRDDFFNRPIHVIKLPKKTSLEKIVETFERINRTGEPLSTFDLLAAKLYKNNVKLRNLLEETQAKYEVLKLVKPEFVLKNIALIREKEPKRKNLLELEAKDFEKDWEQAVEFLNKAYERVIDIKNGYGVFDFNRWMPYETMLVPLADLIHFMHNRAIESPTNYEKIDKWYWNSVFFNRYDQAVDTTTASDVKVMKQWLLDDSKIPEFIKYANIEEIDIEVEKQTSAIYRGIMNLIVLSGALDFQTGNPPQFDRTNIQDDHIFPKSKFHINSIVNRTLITTNAAKGDKLPSEYFRERIEAYGEQKLKGILETHLIPADAIPALINNDINEFRGKRRQAILQKIKEKIILDI